MSSAIPKAAAAKLRVLADWFDRADARGVFGEAPANEVQRDLRAWADAISTAPALAAEVARLRAALEFYADPNAWDANNTATPVAVGDAADIAREALAVSP